MLLNVYDIEAVKTQNDFLFGIGLGAFHSGLELYGVEWCFGAGSGIGEIPPRTAGDGVRCARARKHVHVLTHACMHTCVQPLRCTIELGKCQLDEGDIVSHA